MKDAAGRPLTPKAPTKTALQRLHWMQTELEQQGRQEAPDLRAVLDWVERKTPSWWGRPFHYPGSCLHFAVESNEETLRQAGK